MMLLKFLYKNLKSESTRELRFGYFIPVNCKKKKKKFNSDRVNLIVLGNMYKMSDY